MLLHRLVMTLIASSHPAFRNSIGIPLQPRYFLLDIYRIASFTFISNTSGSSSYKFSLKISFILGSLLYKFSVYYCHLFLISFSSETTLPVLSLIAPQLELCGHVISFISLNRSLVLPILLLSSICLHLSMILCSLSCLAFFWNAAFSFLYSSYFPLLRISFRSCAIFKASSDRHLETFFLLTFGTFLYVVSFSIFRISFQSSSGSLYFIVRSLNLFFISTP